MNRFLTLILVVVVIGALAGCGGGGGGSTTDPVDPTLGERVITGKVVSTQSGAPGVPNVAVLLGDGDATATTDANGNFSFKLASTTTVIPSYIQIDPTGAGNEYSASYTVTYRSQQFDSDHIIIPIAIRNNTTDSLGTFTISYVGEDDVPPNPYVSYDTVLTGRIIRSDNSAGVANVTVNFGTPAYTTKTGKYGYFEINLGRDATVLPLLPGAQVFSINSSTAGTSYPQTILVTYDGTTAAQSAIPVPAQIISMESLDLGDIKLQISSSGSDDDDDDVPPPPSL